VFLNDRCRSGGVRPTIVAHADCCPAGVSSVRRIRLPIGSSLPKNLVASSGLTMATSRPGPPSVSSQARPRWSFTPSASK
jgi:hypothetical protein